MPTDPKILLESANLASEKVATLHVAFIALCTYVVVIVFSTTDMDLLLGKGVKLPVVDVEVPITGFYATAPYLLLLAHFNLLLQLELLSRKLFAYDEAAQKDEGSSGLYNQLYIFPYNYYLVGRSSQLVHSLIAMLVTTTVLLLPLLSLLLLQARFLAYQSESITWMQRIAIWLDISLLVTLWPVIMNRHGSWKCFNCGAWQYARQHRLQWIVRFFGFTALLLGVTTQLPPGNEVWLRRVLWIIASASVSIDLVVCLLQRGKKRLGCRRFSPELEKAKSPGLGFRGLLTAIVLGLPLSILLVVDGERLDRPYALATDLIYSLRILDLHERVLLARPAKPETIADLLSVAQQNRAVSFNSIERIDLRKRSLRHANLNGSLLIKADLRGANLEGATLTDADLREANLEDADLTHALLTGADLRDARMKDANFSGAYLAETKMQGLDFERAYLPAAVLTLAKLQGANLTKAFMWGADLHAADLRGADLSAASLRGADLSRANLQGASLAGVDLRGAVLTGSYFEGADLRQASFYGGSLSGEDIELVDARDLKFEALADPPVPAKSEHDDADSVMSRSTIRETAWGWQGEAEIEQFYEEMKAVSLSGLQPPLFTSCLRNEETKIRCKKEYSLQEFRRRSLPIFKDLVCLSPEIAHGIIRRAEDDNSADSVTAGLGIHLRNLIKTKTQKDACPGLALLADRDKELLAELTKRDE